MNKTPLDSSRLEAAFDWAHLLDSPRWYLSLNRVERASLLVDTSGSKGDLELPVSQEEIELARTFVQAGETSDAHVVAVTSSLRGIDPVTLKGLSVHEPLELQELRSALTAGFTELPSYPGNLPTHFGLLEAVAPYLRGGFEGVLGTLQEMGLSRRSLPVEPDEIAWRLYECLLPSVMNAIGRVMVLELHVEGHRGGLVGETAERRFQHFIQKLRDPEYRLRLLYEYPVMCRLVATTIRHWEANSTELIRRLLEDWEDICAEFGISASARLKGIQMNGGDSHQKGRSVAILTFDTGQKLVYKPRSLAVDLAFQRLLAWTNEKWDGPGFRITSLLDRSRYGWSEFIASEPCQDELQLRRFYCRQGAYLALLHILRATDFHSENLIASGEHPVLIDLEALFQSDLYAQKSPERAVDFANKLLGDSVLRIGLLPRRMWGEDAAGDGYDLSGLGGVAGQKSPFRAPTWVASGTDFMRFDREYVTSRAHSNRPSLNGTDVDTLSFAPDIIRGFQEVYFLLEAHRGELLMPQGPLGPFSEAEVRYIPRSTRYYGMNLVEAGHPDVLRDALDRDEYFDQIRQSVKHRPELEAIVPYERSDLWANDVPYFTRKPGSKDLLTSGKDQIRQYFSSASWDQVEQMVNSLSEDDRQQQKWIIESSLAALAMGEGNKAPQPKKLQEPFITPTREALLAAASKVGERLWRLAFRDKDRQQATWLGIELLNGRSWHLSPMGLNLYDGVAGTTMFLAYLHDITGDRQSEELAQGGLRYLRQQWDSFKRYASEAPDGLNTFSVGPFSNSPLSAIHLFSHLGAMWNENRLLDEAESLLPFLPSLIAKDRQFDIISGAAGCAKVLINLHRIRPSERALEGAIACGNLLLDHGEHYGGGQGWRTQAFPERPLLGFSHGAAGIGWALFHIAQATNDQRFADGAEAAFNFERTEADKHGGIWPDLRVEGEGPGLTNAWCHGAPGIGLSRLDLLPYASNPAPLLEEIDRAIEITVAGSWGANSSLCHGDLGNLELLHCAGEHLGRPNLVDERDKRLGHVLARVAEGDWMCGVPLGTETPGLMTGIAGIGYQLLRFASPTRVPSILLLEGPSTPSAPFVKKPGDL